MKTRISRKRGGEALRKLIAEAKKSEVRAGWFESAQYPDGTPVAKVAAVQEYGSPQGDIPPRPFFRNAIRQNRDGEWKKDFAGLLKQAVSGKIEARAAFAGMGTRIAADVKTSIVDGNFEPLKEATLRRRRTRKKPPPTESTAILRDTLKMFTTLTSAVVPKGAQ